MKTKQSGFQSLLAEEIKAFIAYKRALGRRFHTEEGALHLLDRHLCENGVTDTATITAELLDGFLASRPRTQPRSYNHLVGVLRRFFDWLANQERLCPSPLRTHPRRISSQRRPFLFDAIQVRHLLEIATHLPDNSRALHRGCIYPMIFALLYGLGLRVGEVSRLRRKDVDLDRQLLTIRQTKFGKSRLVPFGPRMAKRISDYIRSCEQHVGTLQPNSPLFSFGKDKPIHPGTISQTFHHLLPQLNLEMPPGITPPRVHCLRHSFAVRTLLRWYRAGIDPSQRLIYLSTFLGHVNPTSTAVYLSITVELLQVAGERFARFSRPLLREVE